VSIISMLRERQLRKNVVSQAITGERVAIRHYLRMKDLADDPGEIRTLEEDIATEERHVSMMDKVAKAYNVKPVEGRNDPYWSRVDKYFDICADNGDLESCFIVQDVILESFAICLYTAILPGLEETSRKIVTKIISDERAHLAEGVARLKRYRMSDPDGAAEKVERANAGVVPTLSDWVAPDSCAEPCAVCGIVGGGCAKQDLAKIDMPMDEVQAEFAELYGECLREAGFSSGQVIKWLAQAI
jgi:fatty aldehyde decarbonylase